MSPEQAPVPPWLLALLIFLALDFFASLLLRFGAERLQDRRNNLREERRP